MGVCAAVLAAVPGGQSAARHDLRAVFNAVRYVARTGGQWRFLPNDMPPWYVVYQQMQRWLRGAVSRFWLKMCVRFCGSGAGARASRRRFVSTAGRCNRRRNRVRGRATTGPSAGRDRRCISAVDTLGHLLALTVTPADQGDREQVAALAQELQQVTGGTVELAYVDQGYTGPNAAEARGKTRPAAGSGQASDGKTRLPAAAPPMGRRTQLRVGRTLPPPRPGLRTARHNPQRSSSARLRHPHARATSQILSSEVHNRL